MEPSGARPIFPPIPILAGNQVRLFLTSAALLFVELLLICWIPANVIYVGYFSNFVLIASFLGIGLGSSLDARARRCRSRPSPCCCSASWPLSCGRS